MVFPNWTVASAIPYETLGGLLTGQYKLYGGVVRWAAGTANAGQIVRHLIPAGMNALGVIPGLNFIPGIMNTIKLIEIQDLTKFNTHKLIGIAENLNSLSGVTQQVLQMTTGTAILSGLGLTVSCIGFLALNNKLNAIDGRLKEIQRDVQAIKYFLESTERAKLRNALNDLQKINGKVAPQHRHFILHTARTSLAEINMRYRELLSEANTIEIAMAHEEYFTVTALAYIRCTAELGMLEIAEKEIQEANLFWQGQAHRITKNILIEEYPERFFGADFVNDVSATELVQWLDFAYAQNKGLGWIDEFRTTMSKKWYASGASAKVNSQQNKNNDPQTTSRETKKLDWFDVVKVTVNESLNATSLLNDLKVKVNENLDAANEWLLEGNTTSRETEINKKLNISLAKDKSIVIPTLRKLMARSSVFESYVAQYEILNAEQLKPSEFEQRLANLPQSSSVNGYFIFEPVKIK